jgi:hypothetical protein
VRKDESMALTEIIPTWMKDLKESYMGDEWVQKVLKEGDDQITRDDVTICKGVIRRKVR